jgi:serine/threonine protein kinase
MHFFQVTPSFILSTLRQIASAVMYLHEEGVIHGLLKSKNIILDRDNVVYVRLHIHRHIQLFDSIITRSDLNCELCVRETERESKFPLFHNIRSKTLDIWI